MFQWRTEETQRHFSQAIGGVAAFGPALAWKDSVNGHIPRGLLIQKGEAQLLVQGGQSYAWESTIYIAGLWAKPVGSGLGSTFMQALRAWCDEHSFSVQIILVANIQFFQRFGWLARKDTFTFEYKPTERKC